MIKVFVGPLDAERDAMVAARSQRAAATAIGISLNEFTAEFDEVWRDYRGADIARENAGTVYLRSKSYSDPWVERTECGAST